MKPQLFHVMTFRDTAKQMAFLEAVGFTKVAVYANPDDPTIIEHAQYAWRDSGGVMFASVREDPERAVFNVERASCYCVVESDNEVDRLGEAAVAAGGTILQQPTDQDYGGRSTTVADPEGNVFSFGSYAGH